VILFFDHFFKMLDLSQPDWRESSILLLDNASYHTSDETMQYLQRNNINVFFSAPYSYDAAPCEMWFSYLKNEDLNEDRLSTGKK
jgi:transposase